MKPETGKSGPAAPLTPSRVIKESTHPYTGAASATRPLLFAPARGFLNYAGMQPKISAEAAGSMFVPGKRRRMNLVAICLNIFLPWLLFSFTYALMSFTYHYEQPALLLPVVCLGVAVSIVTGFVAWWAKWHEEEPFWYTFAALAFFVAVCAAAIFGDMNFWYNMKPFYDIELSNTYPAVSPSVDVGQQLMDVGRLYFADGARLDRRKAMGFKSRDVYCVAPVSSAEQPASYDFWAVGINCCNGEPSDFRCGEFNNPYAHAGLRLMHDEQRPFFHLAVQQAEAAYNIKAEHPIFFYWVQDPIANMNAYRNAGYKMYWAGIIAYLVFNSFCVFCAAFAFAKVGRR